MDDLARAGRNLLVIEWHEDVLRVAAIDPVAVAVEHINIDKMRIGVDGPVGAHASGAADHPVARSGDQLDPDLVGIDRSLTEEVADPSVRTTTSTRYLPPGFQIGDIGAERAQELAFDHSAVAQAEDINADFLVLQETWRAVWAVSLSPRMVARPVLAPMNRWSWISRPPLPSKSLAPKSVDGFSSMWHSMQFVLATSG